MNSRVNAIRDTEDLSRMITKEMLELQILTHDYLQRYEKRPQSQWQSKYAKLARLLTIPQDQNSSKQFFLQKLFDNHSAIGSLFDQIVENRDQQQSGQGETTILRERQELLIGQMLVKSAAMVASAEQLVVSSRAELLDTQQHAYWLIMVISAGLIVVMAVAAFSLGRSITVSLGQLRHGVAIVAAGNLHHTVEVHGQDEVSQLARAFNHMTQALKTSHARLEEKIAEHQQAAAELARSNADLEQFAYVASHDLQEPLRKITNFTQLLTQRYQHQLDVRAEKYMHYIVDGTTRMQRLIQDLLTYSRVSRGNLSWEPTDLEAVLVETLATFEVTIRETKAEITHDPLPLIWANPTQLAQVLQNLLGNALKFHGTATPRIHVSAMQRDSEWVFAIRDHGIGIDPQYAKRIFTIFQRLHTREEYPGTGIGLAICQKIVERHGGRIWVESQPEQGAVFYFTIPRVDRSAMLGQGTA